MNTNLYDISNLRLGHMKFQPHAMLHFEENGPQGVHELNVTIKKYQNQLF